MAAPIKIRFAFTGFQKTSKRHNKSNYYNTFGIGVGGGGGGHISSEAYNRIYFFVYRLIGLYLGRRRF